MSIVPSVEEVDELTHIQREKIQQQQQQTTYNDQDKRNRCRDIKQSLVYKMTAAALNGKSQTSELYAWPHERRELEKCIEPFANFQPRVVAMKEDVFEYPGRKVSSLDEYMKPKRSPGYMISLDWLKHTY